MPNRPTYPYRDTQDAPCFGTVAAVESDIRMSHGPRLNHPALRSYRLAPGGRRGEVRWLGVPDVCAHEGR